MNVYSTELREAWKAAGFFYPDSESITLMSIIESGKERFLTFLDLLPNDLEFNPCSSSGCVLHAYFNYYGYEISNVYYTGVKLRGVGNIIYFPREQDGILPYVTKPHWMENMQTTFAYGDFALDFICSVENIRKYILEN